MAVKRECTCDWYYADGMDHNGNPVPEDEYWKLRLPNYFSITYEGCVFATRERNYTDDSEFYAVVWDEDAQDFREVLYMYTGLGGTDNNEASTDATDELKAHIAPIIEPKILEIIRAAVKADASKVKKGAMVRTNDGRKGRVFWMGVVERRERAGWNGYRNPYFRTVTHKRVGIELDDGARIFEEQRNVEVIDAKPQMDEEQMNAMAAKCARENPMGYYWARRSNFENGCVVVPPGTHMAILG